MESVRWLSGWLVGAAGSRRLAKGVAPRALKGYHHEVVGVAERSSVAARGGTTSLTQRSPRKTVAC